MLHPVGPLPTTVYWRRRAAAVVATVVGLVAVVVLVTSLAGGATPGPVAAAPTSTSTGPATPTSSARATPTSEAAAPPTTEAPPASTAPAPAPETVQPAPAPAEPAPVPVPAEPAPPACPDESVAVTGEVAAPSYVVGELPVFRILVDNVGATACARDLDAALQEALVYSADGTTRLWSSNDCYPGASADAPVLAPGERRTYSVRWSGTTSEPTCQAERTVVPAGSYTMVFALGALRSAPVPFTLT